jgi:ferritin-like metal-binding protein YciE
MKVDTRNLLLEEEIKDLYDAEKRLVRAIPKMAKAATSEDLRSALIEHLEATKSQMGRLERVFELLDTPAKTKTCAGMKGIIAEGEDMIGQDAEAPLRDAAIVSAAQRVEHYEMAAYAAARAIAEHLGKQEVGRLLQQTWDEESQASEKLAALTPQLLSIAQSAERTGVESREMKGSGSHRAA